MTNGTVGAGASNGTSIIALTDGRLYIRNRENADTLFHTNNTERMRIDASGRVGIGTTAPTAQFDVWRNDDLGGISLISSTNTSGVLSYTGLAPNKIKFYRDTVTGVNFEIQTSVKSGSSGGDIVFMPNNGEHTPTEKMRITTDGNVGIGATSPGSKLQVEDNILSNNIWTLTYTGFGPGTSVKLYERDGTTLLGTFSGLILIKDDHRDPAGAIYHVVSGPSLAFNVGVFQVYNLISYKNGDGDSQIKYQIDVDPNDSTRLVIKHVAGTSHGSWNTGSYNLVVTYIGALASNIETRLLNTTDTLDGDLTVTGKITAQEFHTEFVSASIIFKSGSTRFGDSYDDTHVFTGSLENIYSENGVTGSFRARGGQVDLEGLDADLNFRLDSGSGASLGEIRFWVNQDQLGEINMHKGTGEMRIQTQTNTGAISLRPANSNLLYLTGSSVGIGTTVPTAVLSLIGGSNLSDLSVTSNPMTINAGGRSITFNTVYGGTGIVSQLMKIDAGGNVGIGTTSPRAALEVDNNSAAGGDALIVTTGANNGAEYTGIRWDIADGSLTYGAIRAYLEGSGYGRLAFLAGDNAGNSLSEYMAVSSEGHTLFGTTDLPNGTSIYGSAFRADSNSRRSLRMATSSTGTQDLVEFYNPNGRVGIIQTSGTATSYVQSGSDISLKKNIEVWNDNILTKFAAIEPKKFHFNFQHDTEEKVNGYIAQNMTDKFPEAYPLGENGKYNYNPSGMVVYLTKAIQELKARGDTQITGSLNISQNIITAGTIQGTFDGGTALAVSGAFDSVSASLATRITSQEAFSSSLDATFATDAQVATAVSSLNAASSSYLLNTTDTFTGTLTVDGTGSFDKVGIGTTTPNYTLDINGTSGVKGVYFSINDTPQTSQGTITNHSVVGLVSRGVTSSVFDWSVYSADGAALISNKTNTYDINFNTGSVGIGTASPDAKLAIANANGSLYRFGYAGTSDVYIDTNNMYFRTATGASNTVTINSNGNVGIGETSPLSPLHFSKQTTWGTSENRVININNTGTGGDINVAHNMGAITWYSGNSTPTAGIQAWRNTPASGNNIELRFDTAAAGIPYERMRITSTGYVGINNTNLSGTSASRLNVKGDSVFAATFSTLGEAYGPNSSSARGSIYEPAGTVLRVISTANSNNSGALISFNAYNSSGGATGAFIGAVAGGTGNGPAHIVFGRRTNTTSWGETMRILSSGGITFNGDTAAANALDDYEEGTWTATYTDGADNTYTGNYSSRDGYYTKIGNMVYASFQLIATSDIEANGLTGTSSLQISGLPYASNSQHFSGGHITNFQSNGRNMNSVRLMIARGSTKIFFRDYNNTTEVSLNVNEVNGSSTLFYGYVIYRV